MDAISLSWAQATSIVGAAWTVVIAAGVVFWKLTDRQVKQIEGQREHWKVSYEAKDKELESVKAQLKQAGDQIDVLKDKLSERAASGGITSLNDLPGGFTKLVSQYGTADNERDDSKRTKLKDNLAIKLGWFAIGRQIPRHVLVQSTEAGCIVALAQKIIDQPKPGDAKLLATASALWVPPHARHQVMDAIEQIAKKGGRMDDAERTELLNVLNRFADELSSDKAAAVHMERIERVRQVMQRAV